MAYEVKVRSAVFGYKWEIYEVGKPRLVEVAMEAYFSESAATMAGAASLRRLLLIKELDQKGHIG
jgi:predicted DNA-binding transcriptional regulator